MSFFDGNIWHKKQQFRYVFKIGFDIVPKTAEEDVDSFCFFLRES